MPAIAIDSVARTYYDHGNGVRRTYPPAPASNDIINLPLTVGGIIPVTRMEGGSTPRYMWEVREADNSGDPRPQTLSVNTTDQLFGSDCLQVITDSTAGNAGSMFVNYLNNFGENVNDIRYIRETLENASFGGVADQWTLKRYNKMRIWYKPPPELVKNPTLGNTNFHVGTFLRQIGDSYTSAQTGGHWYHYFNIEQLDGNWAQIIVDSHPSHINTGASGTDEHGNLAPGNPKFDAFNGSDAHNYFDLLTQIYATERNANSAYPSTSLIGGVQFYHDSNTDEDLDHIYSIWGGVKASTNEVIVGWKRDKNEDDKTFNVRYSFSRFEDNGGWSSGIDAPNGQSIDPPHLGGYNGVEYRCVLGAGVGEINATGQDVLFIAIKHQDETTRYREVAIPLTTAGYAQVGQ